MQLSELERDLASMIPTGQGVDATFLYERMWQETERALPSASRGALLDLACGTGANAVALAQSGARVVGAEPSAQMIGLGELSRSQAGDAPAERPPAWVRAFADALPFAAASFSGSYCKGSLDHFDHPLLAIRELARVTRSDGRVVLAVANMSALGRRWSIFWDGFRSEGRMAQRGRRYYDIPADHLTRYDPELLRRHAGEYLEIESWRGVSLLGGVASWSRLLQALPLRLAWALLRAADSLARWRPAWADVIVVAGRPRA